jgi:hypothetical protein
VEKAIEELKTLNTNADTIIGLMRRPESKKVRIFELVATGIGILGVLSVIDIIRTWIMGGYYVFPAYSKHCVNSYQYFAFYDRPVYAAASVNEQAALIWIRGRKCPIMTPLLPRYGKTVRNSLHYTADLKGT